MMSTDNPVVQKKSGDKPLTGVPYSFYDKDYTVEAFGLFNVSGANCWLNSILQGLLSLPAFNKYMLEHEAELAAKSSLSAVYINLIKKLIKTDTSTVTPIVNLAKPLTASASILNALDSEARKRKLSLSVREQEGAANGLIVLLEALGDDNIYDIFYNKYQNIIACPNCKKCVSVTSDVSTIVYVHSDKKFTTEQEVVAYIFRHAWSTTGYKCEECKQKLENVARIYQLKTLREVIVVCYDKLHSAGGWYPPELHFRTKFGTVLTYRVAAQLEHSGGLNRTTYQSSGHWWARGLRRDGKFYALNDSSVGDSNNTPTATTQLVFYHIVSETRE